MTELLADESDRGSMAGVIGNGCFARSGDIFRLPPTRGRSPWTEVVFMIGHFDFEGLVRDEGTPGDSAHANWLPTSVQTVDALAGSNA